MTPDQIKAIAKQAGGTTYTNRHYPGDTAVAFGPVALSEFVRLVREDAFEEAAIDAERFGHLWCGAPAKDFFELAEKIRRL